MSIQRTDGPPLDMQAEKQSVPPAPGQRVAVSGVLAAMSRALDLVEGQPLGHSVRSCVIGMRLGESAGLSDAQMAELYYALLLKDSGCSCNASRISALFGSDDRSVKPQMKVVDWDNPFRMSVETWRNTGADQPIFSRLRYFFGIARETNASKDLIAARCERGADIARRLGFPAATAEAIRSLDEHWNGKGYPEGKRGDEIPVMSRILNIAQTVEVFLARDGVRGVEGVLRDRRGRWFDPALTNQVLGWLRDTPFWDSVKGPDSEQLVISLEPAEGARALDDAGLDQIAQAFADIIDAKSPFTFKHSSNVATYACAIVQELGLDDQAMERVRRAGLLHDLGKVGVSNRILDKAGPLDAAERLAVERHPLYTWEILGRVPAFASFAWQASTHHEKLDGSGYPFKLRADELDTESRALVVADIYESLTADRPYRDGMSPGKALGILEQDRGTKLDGDAIDALSSVVASRAGEKPAEDL